MHKAAYEFPSLPGDLLHIHNRLHEDGVAQRNLGNPDCTKQVRPFGSVRLLESSIDIGTEYASLQIDQRKAMIEQGHLGLLTGVPRPINWHFRQSHCPSGIKGTP